jgi:beta-1,2-mannobiose phosphorylase / 1,2-beta-oligomannan phosphorylase
MPMVSVENLSVERLNGGKPVLKAVPDHAWENEVVFNPGCVFLEERELIDSIARDLLLPEPLRKKLAEHKGICVLIYRAQGRPTATEDYRHSRFGIALLTPTLDLIYRHPVPVMLPGDDFDDLGVEDPRITRIDGKFVMLYAGYSSHRSSRDAESAGNKIGICIALSDDLVHWEKRGPLNGKLNEVDNKNAVLFPEKLDGSYYILHRPMEGDDPMTVHVAHSKAIDGEWVEDGNLMAAMEQPAFTKSWIGAGSPPLHVGRNEYLALYHTGHFKPDGTREYDLGICKLKFDGKLTVTGRSEFFMKPESEAETIGNKSLGVNNVLFVCGSYIFDDYLYFPYAGADSVVLAARIKLKS